MFSKHKRKNRGVQASYLIYYYDSGKFDLRKNIAGKEIEVDVVRLQQELNWKMNNFSCNLGISLIWTLLIQHFTFLFLWFLCNWFFFFFNTSLLHDKEHKIKEPKQYFASSWVKPNKNFSLSFWREIFHFISAWQSSVLAYVDTFTDLQLKFLRLSFTG